MEEKDRSRGRQSYVEIKKSTSRGGFCRRGFVLYNPHMSADFLSDFLRNPAQAKVLRVLVSSEAKEQTASQIAKRAGVSPQLAVREIKALVKLEIVKKVLE